MDPSSPIIPNERSASAANCLQIRLARNSTSQVHKIRSELREDFKIADNQNAKLYMQRKAPPKKALPNSPLNAELPILFARSAQNKEFALKFLADQQKDRDVEKNKRRF